jgi:class 3 adenylate cyclase/tetratricopeptide (TPR) repeat protein
VGAPAAPAPQRSPAAYTPRHLAERILASRSALAGEHKQLTVLFADVKGSMDLAEAVDAETWHRILDRFFQILTQGVHRFEGTVNQYTGDGIMALFGAPIAHEDHAQRACYAALYLQQQLRRYGNELRMSSGLDFSVRMGLNCGEVVVGAIGDDLRMDYTAQGHTVGLAQRMEQLAEPGRVYLPGHMAKRVAGYFVLEEIGAFDVRGTNEPVRVFELTGLGPLKTRFDHSRSRGLSRFVGRHEEMARLDAALAAAEGGDGRVVGIVGEPGTGKSRLSYEFVERCRARGIPVREAHGVSHGRTIPHLPIIELLRGYFDLDDQEPARAARHKVAGALLMLDRDFEPALPAVFDFLGIDDPDRTGTPPVADRMRQLHVVAERLIRAASERGPGVMLIEDLHWIDPGSERFLDAVIAAARATRTLLLVNFRPEYHAAWMGDPSYEPIALRPLGDEAVGELLQELLGPDASVADLRDRIRRRTRGNPFFIEEIVQSLVDQGMLVGRRGDYELVDPAARIEIPATVQALLAGRIDRLGDVDKHVLQTAAVIGKRFVESILCDVAELDATTVGDALNRLVAADFLYPEALLPEAEYAFKHPLTREVAYASQLGTQRARRHGLAALPIAGAQPGREQDLAALIAHHWENAGDAALAARWYRRAAEDAGLGQAAESLEHWEKVQSLAAAAPASRETDELGAMARAQILSFGARARAVTGDVETIFQDGIALARRSGNDRLRARLLAAYGASTFLSRGEFEASLVPLQEAIQLADASEDAATRVMTRFHLVQVSTGAGHFESALATAAATLPLCLDWDFGGDLVGYSPRFGLLYYQAMALAYGGRFEAARAVADEIFAFVRTRDDPFLLAAANIATTPPARLAGDLTTALARASRALDVSEQLGIVGLRILARLELARTLMDRDEWDEAVTILEHLLALIEETGVTRVLRVPANAHLAESLTALGRGEPAAARCGAALDGLGGAGWLNGYITHLAHGRVLAASAADLTAAAAALDRADDMAHRAGARALEPAVLDERARLAHLAGDEPRCEQRLREAAARCRALGVPRRESQLGRWRTHHG